MFLCIRLHVLMMPKMIPREPQEGTRGAQGKSTGAQEGPKTAPGRLQDSSAAPRKPQEGPRIPRTPHKDPPRGLKRAFKGSLEVLIGLKSGTIRVNGGGGTASRKKCGYVDCVV